MNSTIFVTKTRIDKNPDLFGNYRMRREDQSSMEQFLDLVLNVWLLLIRKKHFIFRTYNMELVDGLMHIHFSDQSLIANK